MTDTAETARAYLATFLPQHRADELAREIVDDVGPDADRTALVGAAHDRLTAEVRVTDGVAADVLVRELGMTSDEVAGVLGVAPEDVKAAVDEATAIERELEQQLEQEPGAVEAREHRGAAPPTDRSPPVRYVFDAEAAPAQDEPAQEEPSELTDEVLRGRADGRWIGAVVVGVLVTIALGAAIAMSMTGSAGDDGADDGTTATGEITVTDSRTTDRMGDEGPGPALQVFTPEDRVIFWFSYEPVGGPADVQLVLLRDERELISPTFPLSRGRTDSHVTVPQVVTEEPGSYRIELRSDGRVLDRTLFRVEAQ